MRIRSWRGTTAVASATPGRRFPWARVLLIAGALAILAYLFVPGYFYVSADALVQGNLVPVTPIYRARIDKLLVACDDRVRAGQKVAVVSNFLVQSQYEQQYQQSVAAAGLSQIALDEGVAAARTEQAADEAKYREAEAEAQRLHQIFATYDAAYAQGAIPQVEWASRRGDWEAAEAAAEGARQVWLRAGERVERVSADNSQRIAADKSETARVGALAKRVESEALLAPVSGYVVDCTDRPENVVDPGKPLFNIFSSDRAYVLAYFNPADLEHVHIGDAADVSVAGASRPITGRVTAIYPDLAKLPTQLTRFFWQHVQWSEYRPVRISLLGVPASDRDQLYYDAQTRVRIRIPRAWHPFGLYAASAP